MRISRRAAGLAAGVALTVGASAAVVPTSQAATSKLGSRSLAAVLTADKSGFDANKNDFDVLTAAVLAVLKAKPNSKVGVLTRGGHPLTAFAPTDAAFRRLAFDLNGGKVVRAEKDVFAKVASLGIPTVETVLLYHVVPGATIDSRAALKANNAWLKSAAGVPIKVRVVRGAIYLQDRDTDATNPKVVVADINKGNKQIAHGINRVLRPVDL